MPGIVILIRMAPSVWGCYSWLRCYSWLLVLVSDLPTGSVDLIINCLDSPEFNNLSGYPWYKYITNWCNTSRAHVLAIGEYYSLLLEFNREWAAKYDYRALQFHIITTMSVLMFFLVSIDCTSRCHDNTIRCNKRHGPLLSYICMSVNML